MDHNRSSIPTGTGSLILHVTTAEGAVLLEGAIVHVREYDPATETGGALVATLYSGQDGNTPLLSLPTKPREDSMISGDPMPYLVYTAEVSLEGYASASYHGIPIFDGITAVQPVNLIPLPESASPLPEARENDRYFEMPETNL